MYLRKIGYENVRRLKHSHNYVTCLALILALLKLLLAYADCEDSKWINVAQHNEYKYVIDKLINMVLHYYNKICSCTPRRIKLG
jgi:hypothetical protein